MQQLDPGLPGQAVSSTATCAATSLSPGPRAAHRSSRSRPQSSFRYGDLHDGVEITTADPPIRP